MRVIGVIDLLSGQAVHARAGNRASYTPVQEVAGSRIQPGNALALARAYVDRFGLSDLYIADLDAILGRPPQYQTIRLLSGLNVSLWLDAGISSVEQAQAALDNGATYAIVGLETLSAFEALDAISIDVGGEHVGFSLDLREGTPIGAAGSGRTAPEVAARAARSGAGSLIVLDLARVGTAAGLDFEAIAAIRRTVGNMTLIAGGGVRSCEDLMRLADCGGEGALVATAIHHGQLSKDDVRFATERQRYRSGRR